MNGRDYHLAYVFERFPTFTQTFCVREVLELRRQGLSPLIFSIRDTREESVRHFPQELVNQVVYLPEGEALVDSVEELKRARRLPQSAVLTLRHWGRDRTDKRRVYEAIFIGIAMIDAGVSHVHSHFAGMGARTSWWIANFFGSTFSFTGHANDIYRDDSGSEITLGRLMSGASLIATVSDYTAEQLRNAYPQSARKVRRVYNGIDVVRFEEARKTQAKRNERQAGCGRLLSVGRLIEKKGFDELIRACAMLKARGGYDFVCDIVGEGPKESELRGLIEDMSLHERVRILGPKSESEILRLLGDADVFVLPCVTEKNGGKDNLPTVIMEAMASGVPCISTRLAGVPEMVIDGETGLLIEERDTAGLSVALADLLGDWERANRMGEAGIRLAEERFSVRRTAESLLMLLIANGLVRSDWRLMMAKPKLFGFFAIQWLRFAYRRVFWRPRKVVYLENGSVLSEKQLRNQEL